MKLDVQNKEFVKVWEDSNCMATEPYFVQRPGSTEEEDGFAWGPFKYYVIKEVGGWGQKMAILNDLQYCKSSKSWVGGPKKVKNMMT